MRLSITSSIAAELRAVNGVRSWANAPLAPFTTVGTGGKVGILLTVSDRAALVRVLEIIERADLPWLCLGAGSNLLVADEGYAGVVIKLDDGFQYVDGLPDATARGRRAVPPATAPGAAGDADAAGCAGADDAPVVLTVGGGAFLARLAAVVAESGLSGLEFACGIPGSLGGGVAMNAGAHGGCLADVVEAIELTYCGGVGWVDGASLHWSYRWCELPEGALVTAARLRLRPGDADQILEHHRALLRKRRQTQPRGMRTFGSVFKNPPGDAAGRLLEAAGVKGLRRGGAEVSTVHANFLVNLGDATTADMLNLMAHMREAVRRNEGILLEPEVKLVGARFPWEPAEETAPRPSQPHG